MSYRAKESIDTCSPLYIGNILRGSISRVCLESALQDFAGQTIAIDASSLPDGNYSVLDDTRVVILSPCLKTTGLCRFVLGSNVIVDGGNNSLVNTTIDFASTSENSVISRVKIIGGDSLGRVTPGIRFLASQTSIPARCAVTGCTVENMEAAYEHRAGHLSVCSGNTAIGCQRGFLVYSGESCTFDAETSLWDATKRLPIVGFLNISTTDHSYGRGIVDNVYSNIKINGWTEEGFAFDGRANEVARRSFVFNSHILSASSSGVTICRRFQGEIKNCVLVFHTGNLAGRFFPISGCIDGSISIDGFGPEFESVSQGDFISIELECYGNTVENLEVQSTGDITGVSFWAWGGWTTIKTVKTKNSRIELWSLVDNTGDTVYASKNIYTACHGVTIIDNRPTKMYPLLGTSVDGWHTHENDRLHSIYINQNEYYWSNKVQDDCVDSSFMVCHGISVLCDKSTRNYYRRVANLMIDKVNKDDAFSGNSVSPTLSRLGAYSAKPEQQENITLTVGQSFI